MKTLTEGESIDPTDRKRPMAGVTGVFGFGSDIFHFLYFFLSLIEMKRQFRVFVQTRAHSKVIG